MKKIMMLGGISFIIPVIKRAQALGLHVISCDYLPNNPAHEYSNEYYNVSTMDKEAVLSLAIKLKIDGIMSFAVDSGVEAAAYVAEKMGLPGLPYESVRILQNKGLFREFLKENDFSVPQAKSFKTKTVSEKDLFGFSYPLIIKPVDSAGSKGVKKVHNFSELTQNIDEALRYSFSKEFIIEEFIEKKGYSSDTDCFSVNGKLEFVSFSNQYFDSKAANPYTPSAYSWPSSMSQANIKILVDELQRLITLLNLTTSIYNIETREGVDGKPYIMEVSPRGGGNRLSEMLKYATGIDLITNAIKMAIGDESINVTQKDYDGAWAEIILHADYSGYFEELIINSAVREKNLIENDLWVKKGDLVNSFNGANDAIGTLVLRFDNQKELMYRLNNLQEWLEIRVR